MSELTSLSADATIEEILTVIGQDGAVILRDMIEPQGIDRVLREIAPYMDATQDGSDQFSGFKTTRTGALVARSPACRELIMNETVLAVAKSFLEPYCSRIQLHLGQIIRLRPGQEKQAIHRDRWAWGTYLKDVEPQFNTIWAISDFTLDNGATQVVPGSIGWADDRRPTSDEIGYAEMTRGSALLYTGSVFHAGGENRSDSDRVGMNLTYSLAWLRQEENQYLSCPPEIARDLSPEMQDLLGYTLGSYALGYYSPPLPPGEGPESVGPEHALGRGGELQGLGSEKLFDDVVKQTRG